MVACSVCSNSSRFKKISYFSYPSDSSRRNSWLKAVGREDLIPQYTDKKRQYAKICEEHFEMKYFRYSANNSIKFLKNNAIPTLRLSNQSSVVYQEVAASTSHSEDKAGTEISQYVYNNVPNNLVLTGWSVNPSCNLVVLNDVKSDINLIRKPEVVSECKTKSQASNSETLSDPTNIAIKRRKLSLQLVPVTAKIAKPYLYNNDTDKFMPKGMSQLIKWHRELNGDGIDDCNIKSFLCFALHLHYLGPTTYRFLKNTFSLPSLNTLKRLVKPRGTKINNTLFSVLKIKLDKMGPHEKICSVCVSCVPIKTNLFYDITHDRIIGFNDINDRQKYEPAQYAVIIMIRGIVVNWKQLIGYAFLSPFLNNAEIKAWINVIISHLLKIGFDVRAIVSDHSDFLHISKSLNIDNTCLFIRGQKIYYMFDVPCLINSVKDHLMVCNYIFEDKIAKWYHIQDMYNQDKNSIVRIAPKLTDNHFRPSKRVQLSAQVLSTTVAFALNTLMQSNLIDSAAKDTVELILKLDKLFDLLNSSKLRCPNKFKKAFCGDDFQIDFLQEMLGFFRRLKLVETGRYKRDVTDSVNFIKCFQITIKSFLHLFNDLQLEGIKCIYTRRLNLEPLNQFFDRVNQTNGISLKPTCRQVCLTFNKIFVSDILKEPVKKNCGNDFESLLAKQEDNSSLIEAFSPNTEDVTPILIETNDYQFELPQKHGLLFLSVYLYKKCLEKHKCEKIGSYVNMCDQELAECSQNYNAESHTALPDNFYSFIELLDKHFCGYFNKMSNSNSIYEYLHDVRSPNIGIEVLLQIRDYTFEAPCECFPVEYVKKLFVRSRIYHSVKKYNAFLKTGRYGKIPFDVCIL